MCRPRSASTRGRASDLRSSRSKLRGIPVIAQKVAARLADNMIEDYNKENLTGATLTRDFLNKKRAEASRKVDDASRGLAEFLALHPQFQWGLNDSPYAATAAAAGAAPARWQRAPMPARVRSVDPALARLEGDLGRVEAELSPPSARPLPVVTNVEAQKQRDAAAAALAQAEGQLAEKLTVVTPAHPDAVAAKAKVTAARAALAASDAALHEKAPPAAVAETADLAPEVKARLERERGQIRARLAERRKELAGGGATGAAAAPVTPVAVAGADAAPKQDIVALISRPTGIASSSTSIAPATSSYNVELHRAGRRHLRRRRRGRRARSEMRISTPALPADEASTRARARMAFLIGAIVALLDIALGYAGARASS